MSMHSSPETDAGMAIEHTAVRQLRGGTFGAPTIKRIYLPLPITRREGGTAREQKIMGPKQLIAELKPGDKVESYFSVNFRKPVTDYKYGFMFEFRAADKSGQITIKYWGGQDKGSVQKLYDSFDREQVVRVRGEAQEYKGQLEVSISEKNGGWLERMAEGEYDLQQLVKSYENIEEMKARLRELVSSIQDPAMRKLLDDFFGDEQFMNAFSDAPASITLHSAAVGGLIHHTINVAEICNRIAELHPELDRDLVLTGALLHDIGKIQSFKVTSNISQTEEGNLVGHIILGDQELMARIARVKDFPELTASKLRHILLSHHGKKEWGSPVEPMFPEALAVHEADDIDAKLDNMITRREDAVTEDDWIWDARHNRLIYLK
jgi:3'-5' exoribonuclease